MQLKLKHEFLEFTSNYIEQLLPSYLAPTPSALLARFRPPYGDPALRDGVPIARGEIIEATYLERGSTASPAATSFARRSPCGRSS